MGKRMMYQVISETRFASLKALVKLEERHYPVNPTMFPRVRYRVESFAKPKKAIKTK